MCIRELGITLILGASLLAASCAGGPAERPTQYTDLDDSASTSEPGIFSDDISLMREAYLIKRLASAEAGLADSDVTAVEADALAEEAYLVALSGDREYALSLWIEAISLLETIAPDTTLQSNK